jgi:hypothetical protein
MLLVLSTDDSSWSNASDRHGFGAARRCSYYALERGMVKWPLALRQEVAAQATRALTTAAEAAGAGRVANAEPVSTMEWRSDRWLR